MAFGGSAGRYFSVWLACGIARVTLGEGVSSGAGDDEQYAIKDGSERREGDRT